MSDPSHPPLPWHARPRVLQTAVALLALVAATEGLLLLRAERRVERVVERVDAVRALTDLGLGARPGRLLLVTQEETGFSLADLAALQDQTQALVADFARRKGVEPELAEMMVGALSGFVAAYADYRVLDAIGALSEGDRTNGYKDLDQRCRATAEILLGPALAAEFIAEFTPRWRAWTEPES